MLESLFGAENRDKVSANIRSVFSELGLDRLFTADVADYFTSDPDLIRERQAFFTSRNEGLTKALLLLKERLGEFSEYRLPNKSTAEQLFRQVTDAAFYIHLIDDLYALVKPLEAEKESKAAKELIDRIVSDAESEEFRSFKKGMEEIAGRLLNVKSVTIGVNLNSHLRPKEAGLVSINTEPYRSGNLLDRILRLDFSSSDFHCLSPMTNVAASLPDELQPVVNESLNAALEKMLLDALKKSRTQVNTFFYAKMEVYEKLSHELTFILSAYEFLDSLRENGLPLCVPSISEKNECHISKLYHPLLPDARRVDCIVPNDVSFDDTGRLFILTGPNSGGKTVYVRALAIAQLLFQLGLPIPAKSAEMKVMQEIFTFFPRNQAENKSTGRLEEECRALAEMLEKVDADSLVLMDETFSSTSAKDGAVLAESCLGKLRKKGCMCIFSTHIHELASRVPQMNETDPGHDRVDLLAAEIVDSVRTYRILRGYTDGTSDARTIAAKYGLLS